MKVDTLIPIFTTGRFRLEDMKSNPRWLVGGISVAQKKVVRKPWIFVRIFRVDPSSGTQNLVKVKS